MKKLNSLFILCALVFAQSETISVNFKNTDVQDVATTIAKKLGKNVIVHTDVDAKITATLDAVSPRRALDIICQTHKLTWVEEDDLVIIYSREGFLSDSGGEPTAVERVVVKYRSVKSVFEKVTVGSEAPEEGSAEGAGISLYGGKVYFDEPSNSLTIIDTPENIARLKEIITQFDVKLSSVLIEAKIVNIQITDEKNLGINWSKLGDSGVSADFKAESGGVYIEGKNNLQIGKLTLPFEQVIDAIAYDNDVHLLSNPRLSVISGEEASIRVGKNLSYKSTIVTESGQTLEDYKFVNVGIMLKVKPYIYGESIKLEIHPEVSTAFQKEAGAPPTVDTSEATTIIYVQDGESIILGGLIDEEDSVKKSGVPILSKIPLLGWFFRKTEKKNNKSELVVFIKVKIL